MANPMLSDREIHAGVIAYRAVSAERRLWAIAEAAGLDLEHFADDVLALAAGLDLRDA